MSGPLIAPRPHAFGCYVRSHSVLRSATATRVLHLSVMSFLSDGGCADASGMLSWYRVSSFLLNHDSGATQARCSPEVQRNAYIEPWHTRCLRGACPPSSFTAQPSALAGARWYRCCEPWTHSSLCRHSALPCLRFTAHRHRQSTTSSLEQVQGTMLSHK